MSKEYYTEKEWEARIASFGRVVDIRNFKDLAADILLGEREALLQRNNKPKKKCIAPKSKSVAIPKPGWYNVP